MTSISDVMPTGNPYIDGVFSGRKWADLNLTFSFPTDASFYGGTGYSFQEEWDNNFAPVTPVMANAIRKILEGFAAVTNLGFTEITESSSTHAVLRFAQSDDALPTAGAYYPSTTEAGGDTWFSTGNYLDQQLGNYEWLTTIHEIGHALGLKHPHESDTYNGNFFPVLPADRNSLEFSVMSYNSYINAAEGSYVNEQFGYPQSLMMLDILALQNMYGADFTANGGNTTYTWSEDSGEMFVNGVGQGTPGANRIFLTVWDGNGVDTYDLSNYTNGVTVDLRPGEWTTTVAAQLVSLKWDGSQTARGNIANALLFNGDTRSLIENAIGGAGADSMIGNQTNNRLEGRGGNDYIYGFAGNDVLIGGAGGDFMRGDAGIDMASYATSTTGVRADLQFRGFNTGDAAGDRYATIEGLVGSNHDDDLRGDTGANFLYGSAGNDRLTGRGGSDFVFGGVGTDTLDGGAGADRLHGGSGRDTASYASASSAVLADMLAPAINTGDAAGDIYIDIESLEGSNLSDSLRGDHGANFLYGNAGDDLLYGRNGNDQIFGGAHNDSLSGGGGNDKLHGGTHDDTLAGNSGNDILIGAQGVDRFVFNTALNETTNVDLVWDFEVNVDQILLTRNVFTSLTAGVLAADAFTIGFTAADAEDRLVYDNTNGNLYFDADGFGGDDQVLFAKLSTGLDLDATDFWVV